MDVYGNLLSNSSKYATIQGNDNAEYAGTVINIYEGTIVKRKNKQAIYHPQSWELNVYGGEITGIIGIKMRVGKLTVKGGTIKRNAVFYHRNIENNSYEVASKVNLYIQKEFLKQ